MGAFKVQNFVRIPEADGEDEEIAKSQARKNCYMWMVLDGEHHVRTYNFKWTRSGKNVLSFLEGFKGIVIQSDGYSSYDSAISYWNENNPEHKIELSNCNVHSRRKFTDEDWEKLLPWNIKITPYESRGEWVKD